MRFAVQQIGEAQDTRNVCNAPLNLAALDGSALEAKG